MAKKGDSYKIVLKKPHLGWGTHRYTDSREPIYGEGYIPIPANVAYNLELYNSVGTGGSDILGENIFECSSADGFFHGLLRAQGSQSDERFAKQFSGDKNLKAIGSWYQKIGASVGDTIKVSWVNSKKIIIEKL